MTGAADQTGTSHFVELTEADCWDKLGSRTTGRIGWSFGDTPFILPVTYALHTNRIVFRTSPYGILSQLSRRTNVAFEVDEIDEAARRGWSVMVQGSAEGVRLPFDLTTLWANPGIVPWAPGTRNIFIAVTPHAISGRSVRAPFSD